MTSRRLAIKHWRQTQTAPRGTSRTLRLLCGLPRPLPTASWRPCREAASAALRGYGSPAAGAASPRAPLAAEPRPLRQPPELPQVQHAGPGGGGRWRRCQLPSRCLDRDFSNGYLVAEILSRRFPAHVQPDAYRNGCSLAAKLSNWSQLRRVRAPRSAGAPLSGPAQLRTVPLPWSSNL